MRGLAMVSALVRLLPFCTFSVPSQPLYTFLLIQYSAKHSSTSTTSLPIIMLLPIYACCPTASDYVHVIAKRGDSGLHPGQNQVGEPGFGVRAKGEMSGDISDKYVGENTYPGERVSLLTPADINLCITNLASRP